MLETLDREERLRLVKFVCSFAWADLEVQVEEREFVKRLVERLELDDAERGMVDEWLQVPPRPEEVDPADEDPPGAPPDPNRSSCICLAADWYGSYLQKW